MGSRLASARTFAKGYVDVKSGTPSRARDKLYEHRQDGTIYGSIRNRDEITTSDNILKLWDASSTKPKSGCGGCKVGYCAFDRYSTVSSNEEDEEDIGFESVFRPIRYCKCMSAADLKATNDQDKDLDIEIGNIVTVDSCDAKPSDWEGSDIGEVVEFELKTLSESQMDAIAEKTNPKLSDLYVVFERGVRECHFFMLLSCHSNYKNITHIAYSCHKEITRKARFDCKKQL